MEVRLGDRQKEGRNLGRDLPARPRVGGSYGGGMDGCIPGQGILVYIGMSVYGIAVITMTLLIFR